VTRYIFTDAQRAEILARYSGGEIVRTIAQDYGCSPGTIHKQVIRSSDAFKPGTRTKGGLHPITDADRADILARYAAGEPVRTIAERFGCSPKTLHTRVIRDSDVFDVGHKRSKHSPEQKQAMVERYQAGESLRTISRDLGCTPGNVRWIVLARGVDLRPDGRPAVAAATLELVRRRRAEGVSHQKIAAELGVSGRTVLGWCRRIGMPVARRSGAAHPSWKGGRTQTRGGYIGVKVDPGDPMASMADTQGYVLEHRLILARSLGRPLTRRETVHHRNGDKTDNRLENLQLRQGNHGKGVRMQCLDCGSHNIGHPEL
jgi:transposase-like protein